jgi:hypothetical protein
VSSISSPVLLGGGSATCVSDMARLGVAPHVADKILNHQSGTISGVASVYQRHDFLAGRRAALDLWGAHDRCIVEHIRLCN